jgi:hypothetical protein
MSYRIQMMLFWAGILLAVDQIAVDGAMLNTLVDRLDAWNRISGHETPSGPAHARL